MRDGGECFQAMQYRNLTTTHKVSFKLSMFRLFRYARVDPV